MYRAWSRIFWPLQYHEETTLNSAGPRSRSRLSRTYPREKPVSAQESQLIATFHKEGKQHDTHLADEPVLVDGIPPLSAR